VGVGTGFFFGCRFSYFLRGLPSFEFFFEFTPAKGETLRARGYSEGFEPRKMNETSAGWWEEK
jgi:hypothetical protein